MGAVASCDHSCLRHLRVADFLSVQLFSFVREREHLKFLEPHQKLVLSSAFLWIVIGYFAFSYSLSFLPEAYILFYGRKEENKSSL